MKNEMKITYTRNGEAKILTTVFDGCESKSKIDEFVLEIVMKSEVPNLVSLHPTLTDVARGAPATKALSNQELQAYHRIFSLKYEMGGQEFKITT